jgi:uroporphyrinogen decarboxylase
MAGMTTRERFQRMFEHRDADRIPIIDEPWASTIERWQREGLPLGVDFSDFFDLDRVARIHVDNSPRYPVRVIEQTDSYKIHSSAWGVTMKDWKHAGGTPEFLAHTITGPDAWREAKKRMTPTPDRIDWKDLQINYPEWRRRGLWLQAVLFFGFDVTHSWVVGTERVLLAMVEEPDWIRDMFDHELTVALALLDQAWDRGYTFDSIIWWEDMGYKHNQFFSLNMYRDLVKPFQQRAIDWAHAKGLKAHLHSCGDVNPFVPELVGLGLDALNPLEVKAGMNPVELKARFGDKLVLHGGINAVLWDNVEAISAEMRQVVPVLKEHGGYIFSSDHSVPDTVSLENFRRITDLAKKLGSYA